MSISYRCAGPECVQIIVQTGRGRPKKYCSPACERRAAVANIPEPRRHP